GRLAPRAAAAGPAPAEPALAAAGVPLPSRAHPGDRVSDAARRTADAVAPTGRRVARGAVLGSRRRSTRSTRVPLAAGGGRGEGGRLPAAGRRQGTARVRPRRGDRALPRPASATRTARRAAGD